MKLRDLPPHVRSKVRPAVSLSRASRAPRKYRNRKTIVDGMTFDSEKEARRWQELKNEQNAGSIHSLEVQKSFELVVNCQLICRYVADFTYWRDGVQVVEDVKSPITRKNRAYRIKVKLMKAVHGVTIREV